MPAKNDCSYPGRTCAVRLRKNRVETEVMVKIYKKRLNRPGKNGTIYKMCAVRIDTAEKEEMDYEYDIKNGSGLSGFQTISL